MLAESRLQAIICTSNLSEAKRFYGEVLELPSKGSSLGAEVYDVDGVELRVSPVPLSSPSEHTVIGFAVRDMETVATWLLAKGVHFERFAAFSHDLRGIVRAPDGTRVFLVQRSRRQPSFRRSICKLTISTLSPTHGCGGRGPRFAPIRSLFADMASGLGYAA